MTTALIVTYPLVVYERDFSRSPFESLTLDEKIEATIQKRKKLENRLASAVNKITRMTSEINKHTKDSTDTLHELMSEIQHLEQEQLDKIRANMPKFSEEERKLEDDLEFEFEAHEREQRAKEARRDDYKTPPPKDKRLKTLYRKISMRTHPDRTDDPEKHKLFIAAKQYYADNNLEGMESVWQVLNGKASSLFDRLYKRLHDELVQLEWIQKTLKATLESDDYELADLFDRNKYVVLEQIENKLRLQIAILRSQRNNLRIALGKPDVCAPKNDFYTFEF